MRARNTTGDNIGFRRIVRNGVAKGLEDSIPDTVASLVRALPSLGVTLMAHFGFGLSIPFTTLVGVAGSGATFASSRRRPKK